MTQPRLPFTAASRHWAASVSMVALLLTGCATTAPSSSGVFSAPKPGDEGIVIAESVLTPGVSIGNSVSGQTDDCSGPGLGITVQGTLSTGHYLFDKNGEPCEAAQTLFDGRTPLAQRQADPAISLNFHDNLGPLPSEKTVSGDLPGLKPLPTIRLKSELLPDAQEAKATGGLANIEPAAGSAPQLGNKAAPAAKPMAPARPDPLVATLESWDKQDTLYSARSAEATEAANREISKISKSIRAENEQEKVAQLMAQLRERERQVQEEQRRHTETLERAQENRQITSAAREQWQQKEQELQASLAATQQRLAQYEELSSRLTAEKANKEKAYQEQISTLSADLKAAEAQADAGRRELVLKAAAKIAEAEQLAHAAQLQEQDIKLREAARLKAEAETMMDRALAIKAGRNVVVGGAPTAVPLSLMETPVVLHANAQTLPEILDTILKLAKPQAGEWKSDWQLSANAQAVLKEKWSLTAEAPVQQVLAQLQQQVKAAHGFNLVFTQFGQSRLLVVTDATPPAAETAAK